MTETLARPGSSWTSQLAVARARAAITVARDVASRLRDGGCVEAATVAADGRQVDQPGLLDGAPGVSLVLLAAATAAEPSWDRPFLLS